MFPHQAGMPAEHTAIFRKLVNWREPDLTIAPDGDFCHCLLNVRSMFWKRQSRGVCDGS